MWTLENARNDYRGLNPKCSTCDFVSHEIDYGYDVFYIDREYMMCQVKSKEVNDKDALECKYYTIK